LRRALPVDGGTIVAVFYVKQDAMVLRAWRNTGQRSLSTVYSTRSGKEDGCVLYEIFSVAQFPHIRGSTTARFRFPGARHPVTRFGDRGT
jgi:hypothetical protein